jgi:hypothetical protein
MQRQGRPGPTRRFHSATQRPRLPSLINDFYSPHTELTDRELWRSYELPAVSLAPLVTRVNGNVRSRHLDTVRIAVRSNGLWGSNERTAPC